MRSKNKILDEDDVRNESEFRQTLIEVLLDIRDILLAANPKPL